MEDMSKVFGNEEIVEKVLGAESKEKAKEIIKEAAPELSDADLEAAVGGMSTIAKVAIGVGSAAALGTGIYFGGKKAGWWGNSPAPAPAPAPVPAPDPDPDLSKIAYDAVRAARAQKAAYREDNKGEVKNYGDMFRRNLGK